MARTLPWLAKDRPTSRTLKTGTKDTEQKPVRRVLKARTLDRTPSTSPAPSAPPQDRMRTGDDAWILVEDELLATANTFTRSLHMAEYSRVQKLARQRNIAESPRKIQRPTDGRSKMSLEHRAKKLRERNETRTVEGTKELRGSDDSRKRRKMDDDDEDNVSDEVPIGDRHLSSLMHRRGKEALVAKKPLTGLVGGLHSNMRASVGLHIEQPVNGTIEQNRVSKTTRRPAQVPSDAESDGDMELGASLPVRSHPLPLTSREVSQQWEHPPPSPLRDKTNASVQQSTTQKHVQNTRSQPLWRGAGNRYMNAVERSSNDSNDDDLKPGILVSRPLKRTAIEGNPRNDETKVKQKTVDDLPLFLV